MRVDDPTVLLRRHSAGTSWVIERLDTLAHHSLELLVGLLVQVVIEGRAALGVDEAGREGLLLHNLVDDPEALGEFLDVRVFGEIASPGHQ